MTPNPRQPQLQPLPARRVPRPLDTLLIGAAFGFGAGVLLVTGIVWLLSINAAPSTPAPGNKGAISNAPTPTPFPTHTPTPSPTPSPTATLVPTPTPVPASTATPVTSPSDSTQVSVLPSIPSFYVAAVIVFLLASAVVLFNTKRRE